MDPYGVVNKGQPRQSLLPEHTAEVIVVLKCFFSSFFYLSGGVTHRQQLTRSPLMPMSPLKPGKPSSP